MVDQLQRARNGPDGVNIKVSVNYSPEIGLAVLIEI
jgi:hypothetical protein